VVVWCCAKQRLSAVRWWVLCWCKVRVYLKARFRCLVPVLGGGAKRISKVKVLGSCAVRVLCQANKQSKGAGLSYNQKLGALVLWWCGAGGVMRVQFLLSLVRVYLSKVKVLGSYQS